MYQTYIKEGVSEAEWTVLLKFMKTNADAFVCSPEWALPPDAAETGFVPKVLGKLSGALEEIRKERVRWGVPQPFETWYYRFSYTPRVRRFVRRQGSLFRWARKNGLPSDPGFFRGEVQLLASNSAEGILQLRLSAAEAELLRTHGVKLPAPMEP